MQSSMAVAGMDALSDPCENILTRRANQWHCSIIAQFARRPWPCPTTGSSSAIAGKKSLPTIEVAPARRSCIGSPQRRVASRVAEPRALSDARARGDIDVNTVPDLDKATALERDESSSRSIFLFEHDLRANASRLSRGKTGTHFSGSCSSEISHNAVGAIRCAIAPCGPASSRAQAKSRDPAATKQPDGPINQNPVQPVSEKYFAYPVGQII